VPVALSCTHVGISSLRIEGAWMVIGQSAGIAAALAAATDSTVQDLQYPALRERLLAQGQVLELPADSESAEQSESVDAATLPGIVLDDTNAALAGAWSHSTNFKPYVEGGYIHCGERNARSVGDGRATATFQFTVPESGEYQLLMAYSAHETRATNVPVVVSSGGQEYEFYVDQTRSVPLGKHFRSIGTVRLENAVETVVTISNRETAGFVIVDALQLLRVER